ncbi:hypothetical protein [Mesorhizobium sp. A556]
MSKTEEKTVTVALNCSVKVSGTLYAPDDVVKVTEDIARRLIEQKAAEIYVVPAEAPEIASDGRDKGGACEGQRQDRRNLPLV